MYLPEIRAPLAALTRAQLVARAAALGKALDALTLQAEYDGAVPYDCIPAMKQSLMALQQELFHRTYPQSASQQPLGQ